MSSIENPKIPAMALSLLNMHVLSQNFNKTSDDWLFLHLVAQLAAVSENRFECAVVVPKSLQSQTH